MVDNSGTLGDICNVNKLYTNRHYGNAPGITQHGDYITINVCTIHTAGGSDE